MSRQPFALPLASITDTGVGWPGAAEIARVLTLQSGYNTTVVLIGTTLLGIAAGAIGVFALLRKRALMGDALSHATLPGIALAFIVAAAFGAGGKSLPVLLTGAAFTGVLGVVCVLAIIRYSRLTEDTAIGAVLSVFFGAGVVLLSYVQSMSAGNQGGLSRFILGQTAAMNQGDATVIGGLAVAALLLSLLLLKEFRLVCFDAEYAAAQGWPVLTIDGLMMSLVVIVTVVGLQAVGLIMVVALIIIPPAAARFWTERLWVMLPVSALIGGLSGYLGGAASALAPRMPAGAVIVLTAGAVFMASMFLAPERGVFARALRRVRLRLGMAMQHALRALYELREQREASGEDPSSGAPAHQLASARSWGRLGLWTTVSGLRVRGLVTVARGGAIRLTDRGFERAERIARNHRLWEEYLITYADIAPTHVDVSADRVEHVLSGRLVEELEAALLRAGRLPGRRAPVASPHPLTSPDGGGGAG